MRAQTDKCLCMASTNSVAISNQRWEWLTSFLLLENTAEEKYCVASPSEEKRLHMLPCVQDSCFGFVANVLLFCPETLQRKTVE
jgi:hypothetical protein